METLVRRVSRKQTRPLLVGRDPREVLGALAAVRDPHYAEASVTVTTGDVGLASTVAEVVAALDAHLHAVDPQGAP